MSSDPQSSMPGFEPPPTEGPILTFDIETAAQSGWEDAPIDTKRIAESLLQEADQRALDVPGRLELPPEIARRLDDRDDWQPLLADYIEHLREHRNAPLLMTGCAPALHALTCHIAQIAFGWIHDGRPDLEVKTLGDFGLPSIGDSNGVQVRQAESTLLKWGLERIARARRKRTTLVTFNGKSFDIPICIGRGAILDIEPEPTIDWVGELTYPFENKRHADLRIILAGGERNGRGTLDAWMTAMKIPVSSHGAEVDAWARGGKWDRINGYGINEMHTLLRSWRRISRWR